MMVAMMWGHPFLWAWQSHGVSTWCCDHCYASSAEVPAVCITRQSALLTGVSRHWRVTPLMNHVLSFILTLWLHVRATASQPPQRRLTFGAFIKMPLHSTPKEMLLFSVLLLLTEKVGLLTHKGKYKWYTLIYYSFVPFSFSWKYSYNITFLH